LATGNDVRIYDLGYDGQPSLALGFPKFFFYFDVLMQELNHNFIHLLNRLFEMLDLFVFGVVLALMLRPFGLSSKATALSIKRCICQRQN